MKSRTHIQLTYLLQTLNFFFFNKANLVHNLFLYIHQSLHVSGKYGPIIRRNICVYAALGACYSVWMAVWYAGRNGSGCALSWLYLQDNTEMHGQQNMKHCLSTTKSQSMKLSPLNTNRNIYLPLWPCNWTFK